MEDIIVCDKLNKFYSGVHALKDLSLNIKKDSVVGLIGDNGAGKSTLIKILSGAHPADSGKMVLFVEHQQRCRFHQDERACPNSNPKH